MHCKIILTILIFLILTACGGDDNAPVNKGITSSWTEIDMGISFDLTPYTLPISAETMNFILLTGERCACTLDVSGSETQGIYSLTGCVYISGGNGDPGCSALNEIGTYSAEGELIKLCGDNNCNTYK